ncbi:uncharacterized protein IUM83_15103 [Phytophthora cinnamomi]|uniref:uncharacterized protein n=1 Tax=Phytophthora cinnamomi TaxID=4785 RepID=UPI00355ABE10|nr:hypothetical protein IUM83_15103 [Phytophthora cinnamomi]
MGKLAGLMDCSSAKAMHMLDIVKKALLQGKGMWNAVAMRYDMSKHSHWAERDMESLHRKFKSLYSLHKPFGYVSMPAHVALAKDINNLSTSRHLYS